MQLIKVLVVDDSSLMRKVISHILSGTKDIEVVATAMNGQFALHKIDRYCPDVIILDLEMPVMDGIEFLKERQKRKIKIPVIILSSVAKRGAKVTMDALGLGASDFVLKPSGAFSPNMKNIAEQLIQLVRIYGYRYKNQMIKPALIVNKKIEISQKQKIEFPQYIPKRKTGIIKIIAIGVSTGGPNALRKVFPLLDPNLTVPILVVQHMPVGFTKEFARSLDRICPLHVKEAMDGDILKPGVVLISPANYHLVVDKKDAYEVIIRLKETAPVNGHRPSVDILFKSIAKYYKNNVLAIIMTGMGKDGAKEIGSIYKEGGLTIAQEEKSCIVFGMPKVAIEAGYIHKTIPLFDLAEVINQAVLCKQRV